MRREATPFHETEITPVEQKQMKTSLQTILMNLLIY